MDKWLRLLVVVSSILVIFVLLAGLLHILGRIPHTLVLFSLALLIAYALDPLVEWLRKTRLTKTGKIPSREKSVAAVILTTFAVIALATWSLSGLLVKQAGLLHHDFPRYRSTLFMKAGQLDGWLARSHVNLNVQNSLHHPPPQLAELGARVGRQVVPVIGHFLGSLAESVIVLLIAVYFLIYCTELREMTQSALPPDLRMRFDAWLKDVNRILGGFVRGQLVIALMMGALAAIGCLIVGIHLWLIIGLVVVGAALIPVFGPYLGAIPAVLAAIIGPTHWSPLVSSIVILIWFVIINEFGSKILYPKLVGEALGLHAVVVLFVLFAGLEVGGVLGVLFAAPLTALTITTVVHLYRLWQDLPDAPGDRKAIGEETAKGAGSKTPKAPRSQSVES
jgi:predicted PurR-regulated permease PerM